MRIRYYCHYGRLTGYGRAARDYLLAMHRAGGVELSIGPSGGGPAESPEPRYRELDDLVHEFPPWDPEVTVVHGATAEVAEYGRMAADAGTPPLAGAGARPLVGITTWEVARDDNGYFAEHLAPYFDSVVVPSQFCKAAIAKALKVDVVPHCFDPEFWPRSYDRSVGSPYIFYTVGAGSDRKNNLGIVKAYLHEFAGDEDVLLAIRGGPDRINIDQLLAAAHRSPSEGPPIDVHAEPMDEEELVRTHAAGHCFVSATRGEAWGLGAFEAAVMGNPVITPSLGGHVDYLRDYPHWEWIDHHLTPVIPAARLERVPGGGVRGVADAARCLDARNLWAEPDLVDLGAEMRAAYNRRATGGTEHRVELEQRYSYDAVGPMLINALRSAAERTSR